jgi:hypothetical protein
MEGKAYQGVPSVLAATLSFVGRQGGYRLAATCYELLGQAK